MTEYRDWLEETDDIKRRLAERYKDVSPSEQLRLMTKVAEKEWRRLGFEFKGKSDREKKSPNRP
jgi:hypothetical protein